MRDPVFIGCDLAWSERNPSGLALARMEDGAVLIGETAHLTSDEEITSWIQTRTPEDALVAIDAPIIAPNPPGTAREADRLMTRHFGRYHAGVYPANRKVCARPVRLSRKLARLGFSPDPRLNPGEGVRRQLEVFPHSSLVALLDLPRIIKYKKGLVSARRLGLRELQRALSRLAELDPPLASSPAFDALVSTRPSGRAGRGLKRLEDELDATFLAYVAAFYWRWGLGRCAVMGNLKGGYILTIMPTSFHASPGLGESKQA